MRSLDVWRINRPISFVPFKKSAILSRSQKRLFYLVLKSAVYYRSPFIYK